MTWQKFGLVYEPKRIDHFLVSHAANPLAVPLGASVFRVFFSGRDLENRSSVGYFDLDLSGPQLIGVCNRAVFTYGPPSSFFSHGVSVGNVYRVSEQNYMLFMGWHIPQGGHWRGEIGRLALNESLELTLDQTEPTIALSATNPISLSYPWVLADPAGGFQMWYGSTVNWDAGNGEMLHTLNHARSVDGLRWQFTDSVIPFEIGIAQAFSRPSVLLDTLGKWHMWFSYRGGISKTYRIGYAHSANGHDWQLALDQVEIDVSAQGWDSEMIEYPFVFEHDGTRYMLYNGNGFGRSGVGLAQWES